MKATLPKGIRLHPRFVEAFPSLPPGLADQAFKVLKQLTGSVEDIRKQKGCKPIKGIVGGAPVFEYRINSGYRMSFMLVPGGSPYLLLVGHHDHLVNDTKRLVASGVDRPVEDAPTLELPSPARSCTEQKRRRESSPTPESPLRNVSDELLLQMTVPRALLPAARGLADANEILAIEGLPETAKEALLRYFIDGVVSIPGVSADVSATEVVVELVQEARKEEASSSGSPISVLGLSPEFLMEIGTPEEHLPKLLDAVSWDEIEGVPLPLRVAQGLMEAVAARDVTGLAPAVEPDRVVESVAELERYYDGELTELLLHLTDEQKAVVDLRTDQLNLLKGVAGSGKTTVAVYRARRVVTEDPSARVLIVTFTKALAGTARELVDALTGPGERSRIEVTHLHQWMTAYLAPRRHAVVADATREELLEAILKRMKAPERSRGDRGTRPSKILDRPAAWFMAEISESIKGRGVADLSEYLALDRAGRETALPEAARRAVWEVYEEYRAALGAGIDWDDLPLLCLTKLAEDQSPPRYDFVVIDEAQDLSPMSLRLVAKLTHAERAAGMVVADAAQSIYRRGFRWKDTGLVIRGAQVHRLLDNHRNTMQILAAANSLLEGCPELRDDGDGVIVDVNTPRLGPLPRVMLRDTFKNEMATIVADIHRLRRAKGVRWGNIAVLTPTRRRLDYAAWTLSEAGFPVTKQNDPDFAVRADSIKVLTMHSAKGLEFPVVYICDCSAGVVPRVAEDPADQQDLEDQGRRLLYVAMTRAMHELILTGRSAAPSPFLTAFPRALVTFEGSAA